MTTHQKTGAGASPDELPETALRELTDGLVVLWRAYGYASDAGVDRWEFAIEVERLYEMGLTDNELRWLVAKAIVEHGQETSSCGDALRSFEPNDGLTFFATSALVLTEHGTSFASKVYAAWLETKETESGEFIQSSREKPGGTSDILPQAGLKPTWDASRRELRIGSQIVKRFRVPAAGQESVLAAFEEESWPDYIDDPLPCVPEGVPKQRLHNAIKRLNDNQTNRLLHFHGNGHGQAIGWTLIESMSESNAIRLAR